MEKKKIEPTEVIPLARHNELMKEMRHSLSQAVAEKLELEQMVRLEKTVFI